MRRQLALALLCLVTFTFALGRPAITDSDEAYYAEAGREMLASGDWTTPHYNFEPRLQKPILFYWLIAATYRVAGVTEFNARLWSALSGIGLAFVAAAVGRRWFGREEGWLAGAIVATSFGVVPLARQALPDMPLALFVSVSIWAALEALAIAPAGGRQRDRRPLAWMALSAAAAALGMLDKGPVAIVLPATVIVPLVVWQLRRGQMEWRTALRPSVLAPAAGVFLLIAAPWYVAVMQAQGWEYAWRFFVGENVERFATSTYNQWRGWMYGPVIVAGLLPWSAFLVLWAGRLRRVWSSSFSGVEVRLICWALGPLAFFMASIGSQPRYILPCLVPLAILLARSVHTHAVRRTRGIDLFRMAAGLAAVLMILVAALLWRAAAVFEAAGADLTTRGPALMVATGVASLAGVVLLARRHLPVVIAAGAAASLAIFAGSLLSPPRPEPVEVVGAAIRAQGPDVQVCSCGAFARTLNLYSQRRVIIANVTADDTRELVDALATEGRALAAVDARALEVLQRSRGLFPRLAEVVYLNLAVWQRGEILLRPDPAWVQRVVLIANR